MPETPQNLYWDACTFLAYVNEEPGRVDIVSGLLESSFAGEILIYTSDLSRVEVAFSNSEKSQQDLDEETQAKIDSLWADRVVTMVDFHVGIAELARTLMVQALRHGWSMRSHDAVHLATAQWLFDNGVSIDEFHTFDEGLDKFGAILNFKICRPYTQNPRLI